LKNQISHPIASRSTSLNQDDEQSPIFLSSPPTSCQELKDRNGIVSPIDGIHLLKIKNKIKAAFCTFPADGSPGNILAISKFENSKFTIFLNSL